MTANVNPTTTSPQVSRVKKFLTGPYGVLIFGWGLFFAIVAAAIVFFALTFNGFMDWSFDEVARAPHPNANVDAVLVETNGGATTSFGYEVFILPRGAKPNRGAPPDASLYGAVRSERAYGVNLRWQADDTLAIEYLEARHASISNNTVTVNGRSIQLALKSGVDDPTAPGGGMLYNLRGRR
jgi:hypothetical protein